VLVRVPQFENHVLDNMFVAFQLF